ncbi:MAG: hypothetical protein Q8P18_02315 [Pseudomonadota bacterium]|nr:hypothetical protein [Pseudomonadota bacterium]
MRPPDARAASMRPEAGPGAAPARLDPRTSAITSFVVAALLGYALDRLRSAIGEADPRTLGPSLHIGYYWRLATSLWWGVLAGIGGWRFPVAGTLAARALPFVLVAVVLAAFMVP